jgi:hypothetical protein
MVVCFGHGLGQALLDVGRQPVPPLGIGDHHVVDHAVVGLGDGLLHFKELLRVDVRPGVLLAVDHAGLQRLVDLGKGHLLGIGAQGTELRLQHVGRLDAELQALDVFRALQLVLVGRQLLHAVVPVGQAQQAAFGHGAEQGLALGAGLEAVDRLDVVEHEGQVEHCDLLGVAVELGQRGRDELHVAQQQGFEFLGVAKELRAGEDLHLHLAGQLLFGQFLELQRGLALGGLVSDHMAELDDDGRLGERQTGQGQGGGQGGCGHQMPAGGVEFANHGHGLRQWSAKRWQG